MANVRIDAQGVPKGPIYEWTAPALHRQVTAVDSADPTTKAQGIDAAGYRTARFDIDTSQSVGLTGPGGLQAERIGSLENKDATRVRIKWYVSLALFNELKLAKLTGVRP